MLGMYGEVESNHEAIRMSSQNIHKHMKHTVTLGYLVTLYHETVVNKVKCIDAQILSPAMLAS